MERDIFIAIQHISDIGKESKAVYDLLSEDSAFFLTKCELEDSQVSRRAYVKAVFSEIEGITFRVKQDALAASGFFGITLSEAERSLIQERSFELKDNGEVKEQSKFLRFQSNLKFAFKVYARVFKCGFVLDVEGDGWEALNKAFKIRNRLTHPKDAQDLSISEEDLIIVIDASNWFMASFVELMRDTNLILMKLSARLQSDVERARQIRAAKESSPEAAL